MPNLPIIKPLRFVDSKEMGKSRDTGLIMSMVMNRDNLGFKQYFNDPTAFLSSTTTGISQSSYDTTQDVVKDDFDTSILGAGIATKPVLLDFTRPYFAANAANAQIDFAISADLIQNDVIRVVVYANYASAQYQLVLSSIADYSVNIAFSATGPATGINGVFRSVATFKVSQGNQTTTPPDLSKIIRGRIIAVNATATNRIAPVAVYGANNYSLLPGAVIGWKACCLENYSLKREITEATLKCGRAIIGTYSNEDKFSVMMEMMEENSDIIALSVGSYSQVLANEVFVHLNGYEPGQQVNKVIGDAASPQRGELSLAPNLKIQSVVIDCANLQPVDFNSALTTNTNNYLGAGQYSYNPTDGKMYFSTANINQLPEITVFSIKDLATIIPSPNKLGLFTNMYIQEDSTTGKGFYAYLKRVQLKFPTSANEDGGRKNTFELTGFFSKPGDVKLMYDI